jgi:putative transcriptional regulator
MINPVAALALALLSAGTRPADEAHASHLAQRALSAPAMRPAKGRLLIASHNLVDPNFGQTVIVLLAYDRSGAAGLVINRPTQVQLATVLPQLKELHNRPDVVFLGGPVGRNLMSVLIRSSRPLKSAQPVFDDVYVSGKVDALRRALMRTGKHGGVRACVGYAGWGPGQLDNEIARGDWHVAEADARVVFDTNPAEIWDKLIQRVSGEWARLHFWKDEPHCFSPNRTSAGESRTGLLYSYIQ